jgi:hypothetical protein
LSEPILLGRVSPNSYQDFIRILLPVSTTCLLSTVLSGIFLKVSKIGELILSYQEYPAKSIVRKGKNS